MTFKDLNKKARHSWAKINGLERWIKVVGGTFAVILAIWGSGYGASTYLDSRYYSKVVAKEEFTSLKVTAQREAAEMRVLFLENRRGLLEDQLFRYKTEESRRRLVPLERERKDQIERELDRIDREIRQLQRSIQR